MMAWKRREEEKEKKKIYIKKDATYSLYVRMRQNQGKEVQ